MRMDPKKKNLAIGRKVLGVVAALGGFASAAMAQTVIDLGIDPFWGTVSSTAEGINGDGTVVVGTTNLPNTAPMPFKWTLAGGLVNMSCGWYCSGAAVDAAGNTFVGSATVGGGPAYLGGRWVGNTCSTSLGSIAGQLSAGATAISSDSSTIAGNAVFFNVMVGNYNRPWAWTQGGGMVALPVPYAYGTAGTVYGVSANGAIIVGETGAAAYTGYYGQATYWDSTGYHQMGVMTANASNTIAYATSADGSVIVGNGDIAVQGFPFPSPGPRHAFRWTATGGYQDLGLLSGAPAQGFTSARAVSSDGTVVVGEGTDASGQRAWIWRNDFGLIRLDVFFAYLGINTAGWDFTECHGISADGRCLAGTGLHNGVQRAWVVRGLPVLCGPIVTFQPGPVTACQGDNVCLLTTGFSPGFRRPAMQWRRRGGHNTVFPVSNGETGNGSFITGANDDYFCISNAQPADSGTYDCEITAGCATVVTQSVQVTVNTGPQMLVPVQLSQQVCAHGTATLSTTVVPGTAGGPITYQWNKNNVPLVDGVSCGSTISGSNTSTLTITNCAGVDTGTYGVTVTGPCGVLGSGGQVTVCVADVDDGSNTGTCDGGVTIDDFLYFLQLFENGDPASDIDDGSATGTPDCGSTIDDLLYYFTLFETGC